MPRDAIAFVLSIAEYPELLVSGALFIIFFVFVLFRRRYNFFRPASLPRTRRFLLL